MTKWSIKLGRFFGIDVYLHFTFLLLLGFIGLAHGTAHESLRAGLDALAFFSALFGCVLLHEFGHALTARRYGVRTRDIILLPIGGVARLERIPDQPAQEFWIAIAGPAVNVAIALLLAVGLLATGTLQPPAGFAVDRGNLAERLLFVNLFLVFFNLLPAFPMDGGRVLRSLLAMRLDYARATNIAATVGQGMAVLFFFAGLFSSPMLILIAVFVWLGASQEASLAQMRSSFSGVPVSQVMLTEFQSLAPTDHLGQVVRIILAGSQEDFPVLDHGTVAGILERRDLIRGLSERGSEAQVLEIMRTEFPLIDASEMLEVAVERQRTAALSTVPVVRHGQLVGLLTWNNLSEFLLIKSALARRR
ncbi:MAG: site-2 protease family protein [Verrucomicrobia bacterium]|jgi:Zn-dependent protease/predicted transcriptional regulator|nr:site-2 protease family protein [Verrucomicrobiota bacterium]